jgi:hypothetical protein
MRTLVLALGVLVVAFAGRAEADSERVALGSFRVIGESTAGSSRLTMRSNLLGGLAAGGFSVVPDVELGRVLRDSPGLDGCETSPCFQRLAELVGVHRIVRVSLEVIGTSNYNFSLQLIDARSGGLLAAVDDGCQVCTINEANEALSKAAAALHQKAPAEGREAAPEAAVVATPASPPPVSERSGTLRGLAIASIVVGGLAIGGGITLIVLDGYVTQKGTSAQGPFEDKLHTLGAGIAAACVGGALAITSGVLFGYDHHRRRALVSPVVGSQSAGARLSFDF